MFKKLFAALAIIGGMAIGCHAATTRYAEIRSSGTVQPQTTSAGVFLGTGTIQNFNSSTATATLGRFTTMNSTTATAGTMTAGTGAFTTTNATTTTAGTSTVGSLTGTTINVTTLSVTNVSGSLPIRETSNQLILGANSGFKTTVTAPAPSQDNTLTIPDVGSSGVGSFILSSSSINSQTIHGNLSLTGTVDVSGAGFHAAGRRDGSNEVEPDKDYYAENVFNSRPPGLTGNYASISTMTLNAGNWDIHGVLCINVGAATVTDFRVAISANPGTSTADLVAGDNMLVGPSPVASVNDSCQGVYWLRRLTSSTTYYLKGKMDYTSSPNYYGKMWVRRR